MAIQAPAASVFMRLCAGAFILAGVTLVGFRLDHRKFIGGCLGIPLVLGSGFVCYEITTVFFGTTSGAVTAIIMAGGAAIFITYLFRWIGSTRPYWRGRR